MTITYRTAGAWGAGLGADLSAVQIDNNFWDLQGRITILEAWPTPAAIESFEIDGNQLTVVMDDATTHGPYTLPTYVPSSFVWAPGMDVVPGQMFSMGATIYSVALPHTTVDPFDPNETSTDGDYYQEFITVDGVLPAGGATGQILAKSSGADYAVTWVDQSGGTLEGLSDVSLTGLAEGHILVYDASGSLWVNAAFNAAAVSYDDSAAVNLSADDVQDAIQQLDETMIPWNELGVSVQEYDAQLSSLVRQNSKSANYTLGLTDSGYHILHPTADNNPRTFTIPANSSVAYPVGTVLTFVNEINTVTIAITTDTMTLAGTGTTGSRTLAANGMATALKIASTKWIVSGSGLT